MIRSQPAVRRRAVASHSIAAKTLAMAVKVKAAANLMLLLIHPAIVVNLTVDSVAVISSITMRLEVTTSAVLVLFHL
jgi:hypothetical protein